MAGTAPKEPVVSHLKKLCLTAALTALTAPAWAALTYTASSSYNVGSFTPPGGTAAPVSSCGNVFGQDAGDVTGSGDNNIAVRAYSCDDSASNFGARTSGEATYYVKSTASIFGSFGGSDATDFDFFINPGEIGAFGSTAFLAGEFQKALLTIKLTIDGTVYMDELWSAEIGTGGAPSNSHVSAGLLAVDSTSTSGAGYFSYGINGGGFTVSLGSLPPGQEHSISYVMESTSSGNRTSDAVCIGVLFNGVNSEGVAGTASAGSPFAAYCGAGGRLGDPMPNADPIARALPNQVPEPMSAGLALTALLAAAGVRRRSSKR
jgi:MYXO-CTERM domain-containing protein